MTPRIHAVKCWTVFYEPILAGEKPFEVRKKDRQFGVGDLLLLREWNEKGGYTGRHLFKLISYILGPADHFGVAQGYCILGLQDTEAPEGVVIDA